MLITPLSVVNDCLASMGESPANSIDTNNVFITSAIDNLQKANMEEQSFGWYFNCERVTIHPDVEGDYYAPADTLSIMPKANPPWLSLRGRRLYDNRNGERLNGTTPIKTGLTRLIPFEDLPYHAARMVSAATVKRFQKAYDGDEAKIRDANEEYATARAMLFADHIRQVSANMLFQGHVAEVIDRTRFHTATDSRYGG